MFSRQFIRLNERCGSFYDHVPAPMFRKSFHFDRLRQKTCGLSICGVGCYVVYINGVDITKGLLAPYLSAPNKRLYYDWYDLLPYLKDGENIIGVMVGTGIQNDFGRWNWCFDLAPWRGYVRLAMSVEMENFDGSTTVIEADESVKAAESPIVFDSLYIGEIYDATKEQPGWNLPGFDDSAWQPAQRAAHPQGKACRCEAEPIAVKEILHPTAILEDPRGYTYCFEKNSAGNCTLRIRGAKCGQKITLRYGEALIDGVFDDGNIVLDIPGASIPRAELFYHDDYICRGDAEEVYTPHFTYHGFQYVLVGGITREQAVPELLSYNIMHSDVAPAGSFTSSDPCVNAIQQMVINSNLSNLYYFPTDCPHREKNGWTGDAALSMEQFLLNHKMGNSLREWLRNICSEQDESGALAGFFPTPGWLLRYGDWPGPGWDAVITEIPYQMYCYYGDISIIEESAFGIMKYLNFILSRKNADGLIDYGFGDWVQAGVLDTEQPVDTPTAVSSTYCVIRIAEQAGYLFAQANMPERADFALAVAAGFRKAFRDHLIDWENADVSGSCQTSQAIGLTLNFFTGTQKDKALTNLLRYIHQYDDHLHVGVIGGRILFHVLFQNGYGELAYRMITRRDFPSYGHFYEIGATTMWEGFVDDKITLPYSRNHHFWGDVSHCFYRYLAGINVNCDGSDHKKLLIKPFLLDALEKVDASYEAETGTLSVSIRHSASHAEIDVKVPEGYYGQIATCDGYVFEDGTRRKELHSGVFRMEKA